MAPLLDHATNNCTIFKNAIQKALKKGRLKLAEKGDMTMDTNPFELSMNMVLMSITHKDQKEGKVPRQERKLKEKDEAGPSQNVVWRPKSIKAQETVGQSASQKVSVLQRLQYLGQFQGRIGYYNQLKKESNHPNLVQKVDNRKSKKPEQVVVLRITYHALVRNSKHAIEFNFEKGTPFPQNHSVKQ